MFVNTTSANKTSNHSTTTQPDTKTHLLEVGYQLIAKKGFTAVGIKQILDTAGVPKGSFYHYFASKEAFGEAIISHYFASYKTRLDIIAHQNVDAQQKLYDYFQNWYDTQQNGCDHEKCLVVKLSAEVADISEPMRISLHAGYQQTITWLARTDQSRLARTALYHSLTTSLLRAWPNACTFSSLAWCQSDCQD